MSKSPTWAQATRLEKELDLDRETAELLLRHPEEFTTFRQQLLEGAYKRVAVEGMRYPSGNDLLYGIYSLCGYRIEYADWQRATQGGKIAFVSGVDHKKITAVLHEFGFRVSYPDQNYKAKGSVFLAAIDQVSICGPNQERGDRTIADLGGYGPGEVHPIGLDAAFAVMVAHQGLLSQRHVLVFCGPTSSGVVWCLERKEQGIPAFLAYGQPYAVCDGTVNYAALKCLGVEPITQLDPPQPAD